MAMLQQRTPIGGVTPASTRGSKIRAPLRVRATAEGEGQTVKPVARPPPRPAAPRGPPVILGEDGQPLEVRSAESLRCASLARRCTRKMQNSMLMQVTFTPCRWCGLSAQARMHGPASLQWTVERAMRTPLTGGEGKRLMHP